MSENDNTQNNGDEQNPDVAMTETIMPNQTLYLNNLNEKLKIPDLKKSLYELFSTYGPILEIVASKGIRYRGQAWIVFRDLESANNAKRELQDHIMFDKAIQIEYSKSKSDVVSKADGTYVRRAKRTDRSVNRETDPEKRAAKKRLLASKNRGGSAANASSSAPLTSLEADSALPNKLLFAENLPEECTEMMLAMLFRQYAGFAEVRMVPGKTGIAFVEFGDEAQATVAKDGLQGFKITNEKPMKVSFAKH